MKATREGLFNADMNSKLVDRDNKEQAFQDLIGNEDIDVSKTDDDELSRMLVGLGTLTAENFHSKVSELLSVMKEMNATPADMIEALQNHLGLHLDEAKEVYRDITKLPLRESVTLERLSRLFGNASRVSAALRDPVHMVGDLYIIDPQDKSRMRFDSAAMVLAKAMDTGKAPDAFTKIYASYLKAAGGNKMAAAEKYLATDPALKQFLALFVNTH